MIVLRFLGRLFIAAGAVILLFLAYELWGTRFVTDRHQEALAKDFESSIESSPSPSPEESSLEESPDPSGRASGRRSSGSRSGGPVGIGRIEIPKIGLSRIVVDGVTLNDLKKGPGHYPGTSYPGEKGNTVISGHRATYGEPFAHLDKVGPGDLIRMTTASGVFEYEVTEKKIVAPNEMAVVQSFNDERLTLTTCHPRYSSKQRMIVVAKPVAA